MDDGLDRRTILELLDRVEDFLSDGEVRDDHIGAALDEVGDGTSALCGTGVENDVMTVVEKRFGCRPPDAVGRTGDQDPCHGTMMDREARTCGEDRPGSGSGPGQSAELHTQ
ncbi:hypothetical protein [Curtobacterium sp. 20TX0008]|uniref:hypothetical protein n=1 Tax=Curtobacterium sp. 20TX0008 TaxID=3022018 RepID=UPI00232D3B23|nr:hypothetical protein [Curtobacterium sp. 20TX0008]MDB6427089.1 hypothetical protein [Curtobacterium sp. 20TX0008]